MTTTVASARKALVDGAIVTKRNLIKIKRVPDLLVFSTLSPIMFILLFAYVFGSAISTGGHTNYHEFLIPGIFAQTVIFGSTITGAGMADDIQKGIVDRFRSLPMARSAVLVGRTTSDLLNNVLVVVMSVTGLIIGWRIRGSFLDAAEGYLLLLAFGYAMSWVMALVGLIVPSPEVVNNASFMLIFPLTFIANTFVPVKGFPTVLKAIANWNPVSSVTQAERELFGNTGGAAPIHTWPLEHPALYSLLWSIALVAVFIPLSVRQYRRAASR
jgi:ABC-2 type transport system permease protein